MLHKMYAIKMNAQKCSVFIKNQKPEKHKTAPQVCFIKSKTPRLWDS